MMHFKSKVHCVCFIICFRHWDISSSERFDMLQDFVNFGLEHWGSDSMVCWHIKMREIQMAEWLKCWV